MRKLLISALSMLAVAMVFTACSSNDDDFEPDPGMPAPDTGTKGTAYATEPDSQVGWVQLWADGPKWAEYNLCANSATDHGIYYWIVDNLDIATEIWGGNWRVPTRQEFEQLLINCTCKWENGGLLCTGKGAYRDNSIFFPAAGKGSCDEDSEPEDGNGEYGIYWSETFDYEAGKCYCLTFESNQKAKMELKDCAPDAFPIRAVLAK